MRLPPDYSISVDNSGRSWVAAEPRFADAHVIDPEMTMPEDVNLDGYFDVDDAPKIFAEIDDDEVPF